ncbi:MAG TPA: arginine--tRNA ligase, partial [Patescibacteria group bacterium]|nr:arginine--tRNA ligase [Patescibacteria group bacterium]
MKYADLSTILVKEIRKCVEAQFADLVDCGWAPNGMGDFSSSIALKTAKQMKKAPFEIAKEIVTRLQNAPSVKKYADRVEAKAPGFINFWLKPEFFSSAVEHIIKEGNHFGRAKKKKEKILLEFLSANPTGPMHMGNGRGGFTGDCLANVLDWAGYDVKREYYINNVGNQIVRLGASIFHAAGIKQANEDDLYRAPYINDLVKTLRPKAGDDAAEIGKRAARILLRDIRRVVEEKMRIHFDRWFPEDHLFVSQKADNILKWIKAEKLSYEKDGAVWFISSRFGDDKDRVLVKSSGEKTYMLSDIAYHKDKFDRGFEKLIDIFGADHHGYIGRTYAAVEALGYKKEQLDILIVQLVRLIENGKEVKMSKRGGSFVTIEELIDEVG